MSDKNKTDLLREIRDEVVRLGDSSWSGPDERAPLAYLRRKAGTYPVIGEGSHDPLVMFIGEAPGRNEAATGRPFCGAAGKILDGLLVSAGIARDDVYITNIIKDRPPGNRDPFPDEIALYAPFLERQINIIKPKIIATLGRFSMDYIMREFGLAGLLLPISKMHGRTFEAKTGYGLASVIVLYHPAVAVYNPNTKGELASDFKAVGDLVKKLELKSKPRSNKALF